MGGFLKKWLLKSINKDAKGPYSETEINDMIKNGHVVGDELIRHVDETNWTNISSNPIFGEEILKLLENKVDEISESTNDKTENTHIPEVLETQKGSQDKVDLNKKSNQEIYQNVKPVTNTSPTFSSYLKENANGNNKKSKKRKANNQVINLKQKKKRKPVIFLALGIIVVALLLYEEEKTVDNTKTRILVSPEKI